VDYANPNVLVSTAEVAERLGSDDLHIIEIDEDTTAYDRGHIAGAFALHWRDELQSQRARDVVEQEGFEALLGARGIDESTEVILYGGNNNWFAAYGLWYFRLYGHKNVRLMDGGRKKWELEERPVTTEIPTAAPRTYHAQPIDNSIRALRDDVLKEARKTPMIDVRSPEEFSGKLAAPAHLPQEQAQRSGHIPGATNVPWSRAANEDGTFKSADDLRAIYLDNAGIKIEGPAIAYCRIGERSSHTWVVLHELLGVENVRNYDGSWTEYGSLVGAPIEKAT
jgi:thiosulfate/3-mercaptopyruvate sulfurtransferase